MNYSAAYQHGGRLLFCFYQLTHIINLLNLCAYEKEHQPNKAMVATATAKRTFSVSSTRVINNEKHSLTLFIT